MIYWIRLFGSPKESKVSFSLHIVSQSSRCLQLFVPITHWILSVLIIVQRASELVNFPLSHTCLRTLCPFESLFYSLNLPWNHKCPLPRTSCHRALQLVSLCPSSVAAQKCQGAGVDDMIWTKKEQIIAYLNLFYEANVYKSESSKDNDDQFVQWKASYLLKVANNLKAYWSWSKYVKFL